MISDAMTRLRMRMPLGEGRIERLRAKALDGDPEASKVLHRHYLEEDDAEQEYRYACFRCMQGDMGMVWEMFRSGRMIQTGFPEDDPFRDSRLRKADASVVNYRRVSPTEFGLEVFGDEYLDLLESKAEEGYPDAVAQMALLDEEGSRRWREIAMDARNPLVLTAYGNHMLGTRNPNMFFQGFRPVSEDMAEEGLEAIRLAAPENPPAMAFLANMETVGRFADMDWGSALRHAVMAAEGGQQNAAFLVAFLTGEELPVDSVICDDEYDECGEDEPSYMCPRPLRGGDFREWLTLRSATASNELMITSNPVFANDAGGYENDVFSIRPFQPFTDERPSILFKPTGLVVDWYLRPWDEAALSERLTVGEIKHVLRLCLDSVLFGDTYGFDSEGLGTSEWLRSHQYRTAEVPETLRGRVDTVLEDAVFPPEDFKGSVSTDWTYPWNLLAL